MKPKKALLFMILFMIGLIGVNYKYALGEKNSSGKGVSLSPAYIDLGSITEKTQSFKITVMNEGKPVDLQARIDNKEKLKVTVKPEVFRLSKNERKDVTVTIYNNEALKTGAYDLSISFIRASGKERWITAYGTNSLRLVFRKEGIILAACNVKDIEPVQKSPFYSILCNFYKKSKKVNAMVEIKKKETGKTIWHQRDKITLKPYPVKGFYGEIKTPIPSKPWEYGDYIYNLVVRQKNNVILKYQKEFNVGEMLGKLEKVATRNVRKGEMAEFTAKVRNIGTQKLPVSVQIYVKDSKNHIIYNDIKSDILMRKNDVGKFNFKWSTKYTKIGKYAIDYTVNMGTQKEKGTLSYIVKLPYILYWTIIGFILLFILILILIIVKRRRKC